MTEFKSTATDHMRRDLGAVGKWVCACEACVQVRSLVGVEKVLGVRPLIREIERMSAELDGLPPGPDRQRLFEHYLGLHDQLAAAIAE
jgi:hypothetical protein